MDQSQKILMGRVDSRRGSTVMLCYIYIYRPICPHLYAACAYELYELVHNPTVYLTTGGAVYILWGRATCSEETDTETVYSGEYPSLNHLKVVGITNLYICQHNHWVKYEG